MTLFRSRKSRTRRRFVERLEARCMLAGDPDFCRETTDPNEPGIANGDFAIADPADPLYAWNVRGNGRVENGQAVLAEDPLVFSGLRQSFIVPERTGRLQFTLGRVDLTQAVPNPPDAFEVALLDATTNTALVGPAENQTRTDAFLSIQSSGETFANSLVSVPGLANSGDVLPWDERVTVEVNLSDVAAGTRATLFFDLLAFAPTSQVVIDDVRLLGGAPPKVDVQLETASDSGAVGDNLTNRTPVNLVGTTDPLAAIALDIDGDGFDDGSTTANSVGDFRFDNVPLAEGGNAMRVEATNDVGSTIATFTASLDTQPPAGVLAAPNQDAMVSLDPGFVEVQWTDVGPAGIDESTFGVTDVTVSGVTVDRIEALGGGLVRYHYADDGNSLVVGTINVEQVVGEIVDEAGNPNLAATDSFVFVSGAAEASISGPTSGLEGSEVELNGAATGLTAPLDFAWSVTKEAAQFAVGTGAMLAFTPDDNAVYRATLTVMDATGRTVETQHVVTVDNVAPSPDVSGPDQANEGDQVALTGSATDPALANDMITLAWSVAKNGTPFAAGTGGDITFTPDDNGEYQVELTANDEDGGSATALHSVQVNNVAPQPNISGDTAGQEGSLVQLVGSATDPGATEEIGLAWAVSKNGTPYASGSGEAISFAPDDDAAYEVVLTATDKDGGSADARHVVTVSNLPPVPLIAGPAEANEGTGVTLTASASDPAGSQDTVMLFWSVSKDGEPIATGSGADIVFTAEDNGSYEVVLTASDEDGGSAMAARTVDVVNLAPTAEITGPASGQEGAFLSLLVTATDAAGAADPLVTTWSITKDGQPFATGDGTDINFAPNDNAQYVIEVTVMDDDDGVVRVQHLVVVANEDPIPTILGVTAAEEGSSVALNSTVTDPAGDEDTITLSWGVLKNGTPFATGSGASITFVPDDNGSYEVELTAEDEDGGSASVSQLVQVENVAPEPAIAGPSTGDEGSTVRLVGSAIDPGALDEVVLTWSVSKNGDPFAVGEGEEIEFTPDDDAAYEVTLTATDKDGGSAQIQHAVDVVNLPPVPQIAGPVTGVEGMRIGLTASATDPAGTNDTITVEWTVRRNGEDVDTGSGVKIEFTPNDAGIYEVALTARDEDGGTASVQHEVSVANAAPVPSISGPASGFEGQEITLTGSAADPGNDPTTLSWSVTKDGLPFTSSAGASITFTPVDDGNYTATLVATDNDGGTNQAEHDIVVRNVAPALEDLAINASEPGKAGTDELVTVIAAFADAGVLDTHTAEVDWGDGSAAEPATIVESGGLGTATASHRYREGGVFTITVTLRDGDAGNGVTSTQAFVAGTSADDRVLRIIGSDGNDIVTVTPSGSKRMFVNVTLQPSGNERQYYNLSDIDRIEIFIGGGNDRVMVSERLSVATRLYGGEGHDYLQGGDGYNLVDGGPGDDTLLGGDDRDLLVGGTGYDRLFGYEGEDILTGESADNSPAELDAILEDWTSDASFETRSGIAGDALRIRSDQQVDDIFDGEDADLILPAISGAFGSPKTSLAGTLPEAEGKRRLFTAHVRESDTQTDETLSGTNSRDHLDVNDDQRITPQDVLIIINDVNHNGARRLQDGSGSSLSSSRYYLDVTADGVITPIDALMVMNYLNLSNAAEPGEGESDRDRAELNGSHITISVGELGKPAPKDLSRPIDRIELIVDSFMNVVAPRSGVARHPQGAETTSSISLRDQDCCRDFDAVFAEMAHDIQDLRRARISHKDRHESTASAFVARKTSGSSAGVFVAYVEEESRSLTPSTEALACSQ